MNLVKLQDDLKMLPMAVLQAKAQGQDPQVPPWLATAVLNERMDAQKKAGLAQGAQGEQPSIAEQLTQKAGLMALQGQNQKQGQEQMMSQMAQAPQPAPEGVPQPEPQEEFQPQQMAGGGLARLPVDSRMFDYREGGIIGFATDGEVPPANTDSIKAQAEQAIANLRRYGPAQQSQDPEGYQQAIAAAKAAAQALQQASQSSTPESGDMGARDRRKAGIPTVAPRQNAAPVAQPDAGVASLPQQSPIQMAQANSAAFPQAKQTTADEMLADKEMFRQRAGAKKPGEAEQEQLDAFQAESKRLREARKEANAIEGLSGYGGLAALGQRHAAILQRDILADTIRNDAVAKMRVAMEGMKQAEAEGNMTKYSALQKEFKDAQNARSNADSAAANQLQSTKMQVDERATAAREQNVSAEKIAKLQRDTQILMHNTPAAQRPTVEENAIRDFMKAGLSYAQAYEKVKQIGGEVKRGLTYDQASDNAQKILDNPMYMMQIRKEAKAAGKPAPSYEEVRKKLISDALNDANNYKPSSSTAPATSTPQPTMAADRAAQFKVIR
jgi:hypothetical protein